MINMGLLTKIFEDKISEKAKKRLRYFKAAYNIFMFCFFVFLMFSLRMMYDEGFHNGYVECRNNITISGMDFYKNFSIETKAKCDNVSCEDYYIVMLDNYTQELPTGYCACK